MNINRMLLFAFIIFLSDFHTDSFEIGSPIRYRPSTLLKVADATSTASNKSPRLDNLEGYSFEVLSSDPLVYSVSNVLSAEECQVYIDRVNGEEEMSRSNPPEVSLDMKRLWPLSFLCIGAALPQILRLFEESGPTLPSIQEVTLVALPPILTAVALSAILAFGVPQLIRIKSNSSSRTSDALALNLATDFELIRPLVNRIEKITNHHWANFEAPVVTRYQPGAVFATHNDASRTHGSEWSELGGQRIVTAITYLNDCPVGGGTSFDRLKITFQPRQGSALIFYPADATTLIADDRTRHESLPAVEQKYIVQIFGRAARVPPPLGLLDSFSYDH